MKELEIYEIKTKQGTIYTKKRLQSENIVSFPNNKMYDCFTNEECEFYFNYIKFNNLNKYLQYGNISFEDDNISIEPYSFKTISINEFKKVLMSNKLNGIDLYQQTKDIIDNGISLIEVDKELKEKHENKHNTKIIEGIFNNNPTR